MVCIYLETVLKVLDAKAIVDVLEHKRKGKKVKKVVYHHLCTDKPDIQCFQGYVWPKNVLSGHFQDRSLEKKPRLMGLSE